MSKYEPLRVFLAKHSEAEVPMSFQDIEAVIAAPLPPVAFKHRAWWSNNPSNSVITDAWLAAGYKTERVDMGSQKLIFRKSGESSRPTPSTPPSAPAPTRSPGPGMLEKIRAALGGTVRFAPGFDPTAPTGERWDAERQ